jgi:WD40 repeat protein
MLSAAVLAGACTGPPPTAAPTATPRPAASAPPAPSATASAAATAVPPSTSTPTPDPLAASLALYAEWRPPPVYDLAWGPGGERLAVASAGGMYVYQGDTLAEEQFVAVDGAAWRVVFSPDGRTLAAATRQGLVLLDTGSAQPQADVVCGSATPDCTGAAALAFSPDGGRLAMAASGGRVQVFDVPARQRLHLFQQDAFVDSENAQAVAFSPDGRFLAADSAYGLWLWRVDDGQLLYQLERQPEVIEVRSVAFSADGRLVVGAGYGALSIWEAGTGRFRRTQFAGTHAAVALAPNAAMVAGAGDGFIDLRDVASGAHQRWLVGHRGYASLIRYSPDGGRLAAVDGNARLWVWDARTGQVLATLDRHTPGMAHLAFSPDGRGLAWGSGYRAWRWEWQAAGEPRPLLEQPLPVSVLALSPDGSRLATGSQQPQVRRVGFAAGSEVRVSDAASGQLLQTLAGHGDAVYALAYSPDGRWLASGGLDTRARLWDAATGQARHVLAGYQASVVALAFSPNGQTLYSLAAAFEGCHEACNRFPWMMPAREEPEPLRLWRAESGELLRAPGGQAEQALYSLSLSPDGSTLAGSTGWGVYVFDAATGETPRQLTSGGPLGAPVFSPDGRHLITTQEGEVIFLDAASGREVGRVQAHPTAISGLVVSADGAWLATSGMEGTIKVWRVTGGG